MPRPTEEAEAKFRDAEQRLRSALQELPGSDDVTKALQSVIFGELRLAQGLQKLAVAIRQVFDKQ